MGSRQWFFNWYNPLATAEIIWRILDLARALAARIELAVAMNDHEHACVLDVHFKDLALSDVDRQLLLREIATLDELERSFITTIAKR